MPKINQEEYETIKLLPDYDWNWIAREKTGKILSFTNKPTKTDEVWKDKQTRLWFNYKDSQLFQFIQWEDKEPYSIAGLIEEYEKDYKSSWEDIIEFVKEIRGESEESEVKKQELIKNIKSLAREASQQWPHEEMVELPDVLREINQPDEPETLSQEWIDNHTASAYTIAHYSEEDVRVIMVSDLQNLLVPKQEEVDRAYKDGYEKGKQHTFYKGYLEGLGDKGSEPETVADVVTTFWKSYERLKEVMSMKVEELEE